jgi:hypothetical protein
MQPSVPTTRSCKTCQPDRHVHNMAPAALQSTYPVHSVAGCVAAQSPHRISTLASPRKCHSHTSPSTQLTCHRHEHSSNSQPGPGKGHQHTGPDKPTVGFSYPCCSQRSADYNPTPPPNGQHTPQPGQSGDISLHNCREHPPSLGRPSTQSLPAFKGLPGPMGEPYQTQKVPCYKNCTRQGPPNQRARLST